MGDRIIKGVGSLIGLATEAHGAKKASKAAKAQEASSRNIDPSSGPSSSSANTQATSSDSSLAEGKARCAASSAPQGHPSDSDAPPPYSGLEGTAIGKDEADWELDDAIAEHESSDEGPLPPYENIIPSSNDSTTSSAFSTLGPVPSSQEGKQHYVDRLAITFLQQHPLPANHTPSRLPSTVIIPQRRPHSKRRGFVRAYAPVLAACAVDQSTFLHFLKALHQSSKASPVFHVINIAAIIVGFVPSPTAMIVSAAVNLAAMAAIEVQGNQRTNDFLTQMNKGYFRPRGLFCLIFAYKPESKARHEQVDISKTILSKINPAGGRAKQTFKNSGRASGKTYGEAQMPEAAPLIFPALDEMSLAEDAEGTNKQSSMKRKGKFVANYFDKRAQAAYMTENRDSTLAAANPAQHTFASRYADPNHPVNSGSPISLLTAGYINPKAMRGIGGGFGGLGGSREGGMAPGGGLRQVIGGIHGLIKGNKHNGSEDQQVPYDTRQTRQDGRGGMSGSRGSDDVLGGAGRGSGPLGLGNMIAGKSSQGQGTGGLVKRVLTENVLYLMVVNMPTEEEMAVARVKLEQQS